MSQYYRRGFTLIESVVTLVVIAILAVTVVPRFFASDSFQVHTTADGLVAQLRTVQQARLAGQACSLEVESNRFFGNGFAVGSGAACQLEPFEFESVTLAIQSSGKQPPFIIELDELGRPAASGDCPSGCIIQVMGQETLEVEILSEGYIHVR